MQLFISHAPGTTQADGQYREWERLFSNHDGAQRFAALAAYGINCTALPADIATSSQLLTQSEIGARLIAQHYDIEMVPEMDAAAAMLRMTRSLAQRRHRGHECYDLGFFDASVAILGDLRLPTDVTRTWTQGIEVLASASRPPWEPTQIAAAADSLPLAVISRLLHEQSNSTTAVEVISAGTAVDWLLRDVALLLTDTPKTGHTAPISDALASSPVLITDRTRRTLGVLDARARHFSDTLHADLPAFVHDHFAPVRKMLGIVAAGLEQRGLL